MANKLPSASSDSYSNNIKEGVPYSGQLPPAGADWPPNAAQNHAEFDLVSPDDVGNLYDGMPDNPTASHTADTDTVGSYVPLP